MLKIIVRLLLGATIFLLLACGGAGGGPKTVASFGVDKPNSNFVSYEIQQGVVLLDYQQYPVTRISSDTYAISNYTGTIAPGTLMVSNADDGFMGRLVSSTRSGKTLQVKVSQASLPEIFKKLKVKLNGGFTQADLTTPVSPDPHLTYQWVDAPTKSRGIAGKLLKLAWKNADITASGNWRVDGDAFLNFNPVWDLEIDPNSGLVPEVTVFQAGLRPEFQGHLTVENTQGGSVSWSKDWGGGPIKLGTLRYGFLVIKVTLNLSSEASGSIGGGSSTTTTFGVSGVATVQYQKGSGWSNTRGLSPVTTGSTSEAKGTGSLGIDLIKAELRFDLYGVAGPYASLAYGPEFTFESDICPSGAKGYRAKLESKWTARVGVGTNFPDFFGHSIQLEQGADLFDFGKSEFFNKCFDSTGTGAFVVSDNGPAPDDIFRVSLDGSLLGLTTRGGTGEFRVSDLAPGNHTLLVECVDDGANGGDIGTLGVSLGEGVTFQDGSTQASAEIAQGSSVSYTIVAPNKKSISLAPIPPAPRSNREEHPQKIGARTRQVVNVRM